MKTETEVYKVENGGHFFASALQLDGLVKGNYEDDHLFECVRLNDNGGEIRARVLINGALFCPLSGEVVVLPPNITTPSHSEETETTGKQWTYSASETGTGWNLYNPDGNKYGRISDPYIAEDMCKAKNALADALNSYHTLKAENERLRKRELELMEIRSQHVDRINSLRADNEAKEKRIQELTDLLTEVDGDLDSHYQDGACISCGHYGAHHEDSDCLFRRIYRALAPPIDTKP